MSKFTKKQLKELIKIHEAYVEYLEGQLDNDLSFYEYCASMDAIKSINKEVHKRYVRIAIPSEKMSFDIKNVETLDEAISIVSHWNRDHPYPTFRQAFIYSQVGF